LPSGSAASAPVLVALFGERAQRLKVAGFELPDHLARIERGDVDLLAAQCRDELTPGPNTTRSNRTRSCCSVRLRTMLSTPAEPLTPATTRPVRAASTTSGQL